MSARNTLLVIADWLFARASELRATGDVDFAEKLERRAVTYLDRANEDDGHPRD